MTTDGDNLLDRKLETEKRTHVTKSYMLSSGILERIQQEKTKREETESNR